MNIRSITPKENFLLRDLTSKVILSYLSCFNARFSFGEAVLGQSFGAGPCLFSRGGAR